MINYARQNTGEQPDATPPATDDHIAPAPRVSVQAFCETVETAAAVQSAGADRRLDKAHLKIQMGGMAAAIEAGVAADGRIARSWATPTPPATVRKRRRVAAGLRSSCMSPLELPGSPHGAQRNAGTASRCGIRRPGFRFRSIRATP